MILSTEQQCAVIVNAIVTAVAEGRTVVISGNVGSKMDGIASLRIQPRRIEEYPLEFVKQLAVALPKVEFTKTASVGIKRGDPGWIE